VPWSTARITDGILAQYPYRAGWISVLADGGAAAGKDAEAMGRRPAVVLAALAALTAAPAAAAPTRSIPLKIGDAIDVVGTPIACFAITSNKKNGMACVLWKGSKPRTGTYGVALAVDGTASVEKIKADGSGQSVFKRKLQSARTVYKAHAGDLFGFQVSNDLSIGCEVINVSSSAVEPLLRGIRVTCLRSNGKTGIPNSYFLSISSKFAGVGKFDAKSAISTWSFVKQQPAG